MTLAVGYIRKLHRQQFLNKIKSEMKKKLLEILTRFVSERKPKVIDTESLEIEGVVFHKLLLVYRKEIQINNSEPIPIDPTYFIQFVMNHNEFQFEIKE